MIHNKHWRPALSHYIRQVVLYIFGIKKKIIYTDISMDQIDLKIMTNIIGIINVNVVTN